MWPIPLYNMASVRKVLSGSRLPVLRVLEHSALESAECEGLSQHCFHAKGVASVPKGFFPEICRHQ